MKNNATIAKRLALSATSLFVCALVMEFGVFRHVLRASDRPEMEFADGVIRYRPNQFGVTRVKNEIAAEYRINSNGWNSAHARYDMTVPPNVFRLAVIGDSYVEGFHVDYHDSVAEQIEHSLGDTSVQAYRFGISGAPMSQYLHMLRHEALRFNPAAVVVIIVNNDFDESYEFKAGTYTSSFLKLKIMDGRVEEIPPKKYEAKWYSAIQNTAIWRYLAYRQQLHFSALRQFVFADTATGDKEKVSKISAEKSNVTVNDRVATEYILAEMKRTCDAAHCRLILVLDGDREAIYKAKETGIIATNTPSLALFAMAENVATGLGIPVIPMQARFATDYSTHGKRFDFLCDGHWNAYGHKLVAQAIADYIRQGGVATRTAP